jgi:hypothetical protein
MGDRIPVVEAFHVRPVLLGIDGPALIPFCLTVDREAPAYLLATGSSGGQRPRAMGVLSSQCAGGCRPRRAVRSSSSSGMTPRRGSQRASFGLHARGNEECRADTLGLAPIGRPKSLVDMLLSPATPEPPGQATRAIVRCQS